MFYVFILNIYAFSYVSINLTTLNIFLWEAKIEHILSNDFRTSCSHCYIIYDQILSPSILKGTVVLEVELAFLTREEFTSK